jgi:nucleoside-diphosphate-sugar epimerase
MKVFIAGASGALGKPIIRRLIDHGHDVIALARGASGQDTRAITRVRADALDRDALLRAVDGLGADAVVHELTALKRPPLRHRDMVMTDRLRIEATANLLEAAKVLGATRFVTQSFAPGYGYRDHGESLITEDEPFGAPQGNAADPHLAAMRSTEEQASSAPIGIALRYGLLYGGDGERMSPALARRRVPVVRGGLLPWVHHEDAAAATVAALEHGTTGAYNVVDDEAATWESVINAMARGFGCARPYRVPEWLFRLIAPNISMIAVDTSMRVSNARAKQVLGWEPQYPTYREGIAAMVKGVRYGSLRR